MSNSIYDILKTLSNLENPQQKKSLISESKKMCNECGMYEDKCSCEDKKHEGKKKDKVKEGAIAEAVARVEAKLMEKWDTETKTPEKEKGKYKGETKAELTAAYNKLKASGPHKKGSKEYGRMRELAFAIRAKGGWGKVQEGEWANEDMLSPNQKKFAALAEPKDKITYADKIAGAKKSKKDEGNEFSGALAKAKAQHKDSFEVDGKTYPVKEGFEDLEKYMKEKEGKTQHGKKTKTKTGLKHERDYDKEENEKETGEEKKGRGRPKKDKFSKKED